MKEHKGFSLPPEAMSQLDSLGGIDGSKEKTDNGANLEKTAPGFLPDSDIEKAAEGVVNEVKKKWDNKDKNAVKPKLVGSFGNETFEEKVIDNLKFEDRRKWEQEETRKHWNAKRSERLRKENSENNTSKANDAVAASGEEDATKDGQVSKLEYSTDTDKVLAGNKSGYTKGDYRSVRAGSRLNSKDLDRYKVAMKEQGEGEIPRLIDEAKKRKVPVKDVVDIVNAIDKDLAEKAGNLDNKITSEDVVPAKKINKSMKLRNPAGYTVGKQRMSSLIKNEEQALRSLNAAGVNIEKNAGRTILEKSIKETNERIEGYEERLRKNTRKLEGLEALLGDTEAGWGENSRISKEIENLKKVIASDTEGIESSKSRVEREKNEFLKSNPIGLNAKEWSEEDLSGSAKETQSEKSKDKNGVESKTETDGHTVDIESGEVNEDKKASGDKVEDQKELFSKEELQQQALDARESEDVERYEEVVKKIEKIDQNPEVEKAKAETDLQENPEVTLEASETNTDSKEYINNFFETQRGTPLDKLRKVVEANEGLAKQLENAEKELSPLNRFLQGRFLFIRSKNAREVHRKMSKDVHRYKKGFFETEKEYAQRRKEAIDGEIEVHETAIDDFTDKAIDQIKIKYGNDQERIAEAHRIADRLKSKISEDVYAPEQSAIKIINGMSDTKVAFAKLGAFFGIPSARRVMQELKNARKALGDKTTFSLKRFAKQRSEREAEREKVAFEIKKAGVEIAKLYSDNDLGEVRDSGSPEKPPSPESESQSEARTDALTAGVGSDSVDSQSPEVDSPVIDTKEGDVQPERVLEEVVVARPLEGKEKKEAVRNAVNKILTIDWKEMNGLFTEKEFQFVKDRLEKKTLTNKQKKEYTQKAMIFAKKVNEKFSDTFDKRILYAAYATILLDGLKARSKAKKDQELRGGDSSNEPKIEL